jgi:hypothetical protein
MVTELLLTGLAQGRKPHLFCLLVGVFSMRIHLSLSLMFQSGLRATAICKFTRPLISQKHTPELLLYVGIYLRTMGMSYVTLQQYQGRLNIRFRKIDAVVMMQPLLAEVDLFNLFLRSWLFFLFSSCKNAEFWELINNFRLRLLGLHPAAHK